MIQYKKIKKIEKISIQEQINPKIDNEAELDYSLIFDQISNLLSTNDLQCISQALDMLKCMDENSFIDQSFIHFNIPGIIMNCFILKLPQFILDSLFNLVSYILSTSNDQKITAEFEKNEIIEIFYKYYMNEYEQIINSLQTFALISSQSISARNKILKMVDIQFYCAFDDEQISLMSYQLILSLCSFSMSAIKCNDIIIILQNGMNSNQYFAFDIIFQSFYKLSFAQEKNWYSILSTSQVDQLLLHYFHESEFRPKILMILKRIVEINLILPDSLIDNQYNIYFHHFLSSIFDFLLDNSFDDDDENIFIVEEESIEIISDLFLLCVKNNAIDPLLKFNIVDALILISDNGNFQSKTNSIHCLSKLYKLFIKNNIDGSYNISLAEKIVDTFIQFLSLPQQDVILYSLIALINIINDFNNSGIVDQILSNQDELYFLENLEALQLSEDSLIVEKAEYLINIIQSLS